MDTLLDTLFGTGKDLNEWQMAARAAAIFFVALALIRLSGRRSFGQHSPFDACTTVLLGAVLSRAVVGASPFLPTVCAAAALVLTHRLIALLCVHFPAFARLISGTPRELIHAGQLDEAALRKALVTREDLAEAARQRYDSDALDCLHRAVLERDGKLTVLR